MSNFNTNKINGSTLEADEWNQLQDLENLVSTSGINPDTSLLNQIPQAVSNYVAIANFYTDNGIANAYNLTPINNFKSPTQYITGMLVRFRTTNANTGASTVNVASLGVKNIKKADGTTDLIAGDIATGTDIELRYDGTNFLLNSVVLASASTTTQGIIQIATNAEVLAGIVANKAVTPSSLFFASANSKTTNGYTYLPNGIILQWGVVNNVPSGSNIDATLPISYPNSHLFALGNLSVSSAAGFPAGGENSIAFNLSLSQVRVCHNFGGNRNIAFISIGY